MIDMLGSALVTLSISCFKGEICHDGKPNTNGSGDRVSLYETTNPNHPAILKMLYEQIDQIGLSCLQKDFLIDYLEEKIKFIPRDLEKLSADQRRVNSIARTKIWQLRTYCP